MPISNYKLNTLTQDVDTARTKLIIWLKSQNVQVDDTLSLRQLIVRIPSPNTGRGAK